MPTPTPTQAEANAINVALYTGAPPPTLAADGSPPDTGSIPGAAGSAVTPSEKTPAHHQAAAHHPRAPAKPAPSSS
jgi:hypothetical protein